MLKLTLILSLFLVVVQSKAVHLTVLPLAIVDIPVRKPIASFAIAHIILHISLISLSARPFFDAKS